MSRFLDDRQRFAGTLLLAMRERNVTTRELARSLGVTQHQVVNWRTAVSLPYVATGRRIADALEWPTLAAIVRKARTFRCLGCGRERVSEGTGSPRRYCDSGCERLAKKAGRGGKVQTPEMTKIARLTAAVDAMCSDCEPEGTCRDAGCPLRAVSPFPCSDIRPVVAPREGRRYRWDNPGEREKAAAKMRELHAANAGHRARISEWNRQKWASMTPEERAQRNANIAAGIRRSRQRAAA